VQTVKKALNKRKITAFLLVLSTSVLAFALQVCFPLNLVQENRDLIPFHAFTLAEFVAICAVYHLSGKSPKTVFSFLRNSAIVYFLIALATIVWVSEFNIISMVFGNFFFRLQLGL
jgi:hypothetical protein